MSVATLVYLLSLLLTLPTVLFAFVCLLVSNLTANTQTVWGVLWNALTRLGFLVDHPLQVLLGGVSAFAALALLIAAGFVTPYRQYGYIVIFLAGALSFAYSWYSLMPRVDPGWLVPAAPGFIGTALSGYYAFRGILFAER